jgi:hypothetical protein
MKRISRIAESESESHGGKGRGCGNRLSRLCEFQLPVWILEEGHIHEAFSKPNAQFVE